MSHASESLREQFKEAVGLFNTPTNDELKYLTSKLWNCAEIMPSETCSNIDLPQGSTYAQGARHLRAKLKP